MIEAQELSKIYSGLAAVDHISFVLPEGSHTALVGPNGAGKSTLLAMLSTLITPSHGTGIINGLDVGEASPELRQIIGVMTHRPMVYERLGSLENLLFFGRLYNVPDLQSRAEELLRAVGLWLRRDEPAEMLSRGYHQRLALARALLHRPKVLLLDEPETGLDEQGLKLLDELVLFASGVTVLAATHRREHVEYWAGSVMTIEHGLLSDRTTVDVLKDQR